MAMEGKRNSKTSQSLVALCDLLRNVARCPSSYLDDQELRRALSSQGRLSKYANLELGIKSSSLNTIKRVAEKKIDGGFGFVDGLRVSALNALAKDRTNTPRPSKSTKAGLDKRVSELQVEVLKARQDLLLMTNLFETSLAQARTYAAQSSNPAVLARCEREQSVLLNMFSLSGPEISKGQVLNLFRKDE